MRSVPNANVLATSACIVGLALVAFVMCRNVTSRMRINAADDAVTFVSEITGSLPTPRSKVMNDEVHLFVSDLVNQLNESKLAIPKTLAQAIEVVESTADQERIARYRNVIRGVDSWGEAIRYSSSPEGKITVWSCGRNGIDENGRGDDLVGSDIVDLTAR